MSFCANCGNFLNTLVGRIAKESSLPDRNVDRLAISKLMESSQPLDFIFRRPLYVLRKEVKGFSTVFGISLEESLSASSKLKAKVEDGKRSVSQIQNELWKIKEESSSTMSLMGSIKDDAVLGKDVAAQIVEEVAVSPAKSLSLSRLPSAHANYDPKEDVAAIVRENAIIKGKEAGCEAHKSTASMLATKLSKIKRTISNGASKRVEMPDDFASSLAKRRSDFSGFDDLSTFVTIELLMESMTIGSFSGLGGSFGGAGTSGSFDVPSVGVGSVSVPSVGVPDICVPDVSIPDLGCISQIESGLSNIGISIPDTPSMDTSSTISFGD